MLLLVAPSGLVARDASSIDQICVNSVFIIEGLKSTVLQIAEET